MDSLQTLSVLMFIAIVLVGVAIKLGIPYPLTLIMGGAAIGFTPGLTEIDFDPTLVLVIVLPPILYYASYNIHYKEFKWNLHDILWLALGLVIATTLVIGLFFKWLFPDLPWALAFIFGAIISPPDAVSATSILKRFAISSRLLTILEGESLINDATGLVLYRIAVVALLSTTFSLTDASFEFVKVVGGGVLIGVVTGFLLHEISHRFFDPLLAVACSFIIPYLAYILADSLQLSGVLAVVVNSLIGSRMLVTHFSPLTRVVGWAFWDIVTILLNCFIFMLIGLELHDAMQLLTNQQLLIYLFYGFLLTVAAIVIRFIWIYAQSMTFFKTKIHSSITHSDAIILGWSGMRGIVSLTIALALPYSLSDGSPIPGREIVIFLTFVVIFLTLLIPGFTLPLLMHWLGIPSAYKEYDTKHVRKELLKAAREEIQSLHDSKQLDRGEYTFLLTYFNVRHQVLEIASKAKRTAHALEVARMQVINRKRRCLFEMWHRNEINDEVFNLFQHELDLEEAYIARSEI